MNNDIKEILENVKKCCEIMETQNFVVYQRQDILKVLDYITNLQESEAYYYGYYKDYKSRIDKTIKYLNRRFVYEKDTGVYYLTHNFDSNNMFELLNILNGGDDND